MNTRLASFHIAPETVAESEVEPGTEPNKESEERPQGVDASDFGLQAEVVDAEPADPGDVKDTPESGKNDPQDKGEQRIGDLEKRIAKAEEMERRWQSRFDRAQAQLDRALANRAAPQPATEGDDVIESLQDTGVLTGADLKKVLRVAADKQHRHLEKARNDSERQQWVASRPDIQAVTAFMKEHDLYGEDSPLRQIPTDEIGLYHAARAMKLESEMEKLKADMKTLADKVKADTRKELTRPKRTPIPPTGGTGGPGKTRGYGDSLEPTSNSERNYLAFFEKIGMPARIVSARKS